MLIRNAEIEGAICDVHIVGGVISGMGRLAPLADEQMIDARGGALLPGLHDHHIHLFALAARRASVFVGPPEVGDHEALAEQLAIPGSGWLRAVGYHESVAGVLDAAMLDAMVPDRPLRIQHRGGRMWFLNSAAIETLLARAEAPPGLERDGDGFTGRLFEEDAWLRATLGGQMPDLGGVSAALARYGVTGITDMSPANDPTVAAHFAGEQAGGALQQRAWLAGRLELSDQPMPADVRLSSAKLHLHENALPALDDTLAFIRSAHALGRTVAIHCVTEVELVFALAAFDEAGVAAGDRIEHASVTPDASLHEIARLGLAVVAQPNFVFERGDAYRADIPAAEWPALYRLRSFRDAGVTLAAGSDAPFGEPDPWAAMAAAVVRRTRSGAPLGMAEALTPEEALDLFLAHPKRLDERRRIAIGTPADLCLLDRSWTDARSALSADRVRTTIIGGRIVHDRVDQPPIERSASGHTTP